MMLGRQAGRQALYWRLGHRLMTKAVLGTRIGSGPMIRGHKLMTDAYWRLGSAVD